MKHTAPADRLLVLRGQIVLAVALPWVVANFIAPGLLWWSVAAIAVTIVFAAFHARDIRVWLVPISAIVSSIPQVPTSIAAPLAVAVAVYLVVNPPSAGTDRSPHWRWVVVVLVLIAGGLGAALFVTERAGNEEFVAAQQEAAEAWDAPIVQSEEGVTLGNGSIQDSNNEAVTQPLATLTFVRPGSTQAPVTSSTLFVGPSVSEGDLTRGPGHYEFTAGPGEDGNFAVAGHRTGWGAPFGQLDEMLPGDRVVVEDRQGAVHEYEIVRSEIVDPDETWVLEDDPLDSGLATLTLTTCDPPGINTKRLIVWGTLVESA